MENARRILPPQYNIVRRPVVLRVAGPTGEPKSIPVFAPRRVHAPIVKIRRLRQFRDLPGDLALDHRDLDDAETFHLDRVPPKVVRVWIGPKDLRIGRKDLDPGDCGQSAPAVLLKRGDATSLLRKEVRPSNGQQRATTGKNNDRGRLQARLMS